MMSGPPQGSYIIDLRAYLVKEIPEKKHYQAGSGEAKTRPFSALISNLGNDSQLVLKSFGNWPRFPVIFPFSSKPGLRPEPQDSPVISARQEIFSRKREGGSCTEHLVTQEQCLPCYSSGLAGCRRPVQTVRSM